MKPALSLKWFVALSFLVLAVVLIIGYSVLSVKFFVKGMDVIIAGNMVQALESYIDTFPEKQRSQLNRFSGYLISRDWQQMPQNIRQITDAPQTPGRMEVAKDGEWFSPPKLIVFSMAVPHGNGTYYICHMPPREKASPLIGNHNRANLHMLLAISFVTALGIAAIILLLLKTVERPVKALGSWAHKLDADKLKETPPDFVYPELNELARLIRTSLSSVQKSLDREHRFLRHASHELRTPISVIHNNVELLKRIEKAARDDQDTDPDMVEQRKQQKARVLERVDRAGRTMKHLTQTLLWLGRDDQSRLPESQINLEQLIRELTEEASYLLRDKAVEVNQDTVPAVLTLPEVPARIVTGNLIRNAFQHTWQGRVRIVQTETCVQIINDIETEENHPRDLGFGLGLQLTRQLCDRLGWSYTSREEDGLHRACVVFTGGPDLFL